MTEQETRHSRHIVTSFVPSPNRCMADDGGDDNSNGKMKRHILKSFDRFGAVIPLIELMKESSTWFVVASVFVGPLSRVRARNDIVCLGLVVLVVLVPLRSEFIGEL